MQQSVGTLYQRYQEQLIAHIMKRRRSSVDESTDLVQSFFLEVVINRQLLSRFEGHRSHDIHDPMSAFLTKALDDFAIDQWRKQSPSFKNGTVSIDGYAGDKNITYNYDFDAALDREWATEVYKEALRMAEKHFRTKGMDRNWEAFERRVLIPTRTGDPPAVKPLAQELGFSNPDALSAVVQYVRNYFLRTCWELILKQYQTKPEAHEMYQYFVTILLG